MKVIGLLNKIANGEDMPKEIISRDSLGQKEKYTYNGFWYIHTFENPDGEEDYYFMKRDIHNLNDEVEIIEEDKKIEKVPIYVLCDYDFKNKDDNNNLVATNIIDKAFEEYAYKINEIIDYLEENK